MKKVYLTLAAATLMMQANAQFWTYTSYKGAFPVTDGMTGTTSNDWTAGWTNFDPQNASYGAPTVTVSTDITTNTTWTTGTIVHLMNKVYVKSGATLTIQPGVIIRGDQASQGTLIITRGSKIDAQGTKTNPIIFTSDQDAGLRAEGDWGGLVILGAGKNNQPGGIANIEGIVASADTEYGGTNDADNSGTLTYVRIEFPGIALTTGKEINGLTFGSVGSGTTVHHIQVSYSGDDSFEWFGGMVDVKYLVSFACIDDDFDTDFGFRGRGQFFLSIRDKDMSDAAGDSNAFESDNDATGTNNMPRTSARFSNVTLIGPKRDGLTALPGGEFFEKAHRIRRNSAISIHNSLITGWEKGLSIESAATENNFNGGTIDSAQYMNNVLSNFAGKAKVTASTAFYNAFFTADGNDTTTAIPAIMWVNAFPSTINNTPDFRLQAGSTVATGAAMSTSFFSGGFVGIEDEVTGELSSMGVYPNPASAYVNVVMNLERASNVAINVIDVTGKVVNTVSNNFGSGLNKTTLDVSGLTNGVYFIQVTGQGIANTVKFVKN